MTIEGAMVLCYGAAGACLALSGMCYYFYRRIQAVTDMMDRLKGHLRRVGEELEEYRVLLMEEIGEDEESD